MTKPVHVTLTIDSEPVRERVERVKAAAASNRPDLILGMLAEFEKDLPDLVKDSITVTEGDPPAQE